MSTKRESEIERSVEILRDTHREWKPMSIEIASTKELPNGTLEIIETGQYVRRVVVSRSERASVRRSNFEVVK